ncbi:MAG: hypothetical protein RMJ43_13280, partial [Chloroherpetonaceae bacterium]|nr:hypothetical protein [Chloroherpetonaceae bacterium]
MSVDARRHIIDYLRKELIGPDPIPPHTQPDGEEILTVDSPLIRYGAGILFPQSTPTETMLTLPSEEAAILDDETLLEKPEDIPDDLAGSARGNSDPVDVPEDSAFLTNAYLPSAMGLSCLLEVPDRGLIVTVRAARYHSERGSYTTKDGTQKPSTRWLRRPF